MKNLLLLAMAFVIMACEPTYIHTMDVTDGEIILVRDSQSLFKVGDTLLLSSVLELSTGYSIYGKYIGVTPYQSQRTITINGESVLRTVNYTKVVRIK